MTANNLCSVLIDDQLLHMAVDKERLGCLVVIEGRQLS